MIVSVTNKIGKGELVLGTIGWPAKAGTQVTLSDEKFLNSDIQQAIEQGLLEVKDSGAKPEVAKKIKIQNVHNKPVNINSHSLDPGDFAYLSEEEMRTNNVINAISVGFIKVINDVEVHKVGDKDNPATEEDVKKVKKKVVKKKTKKKKSKKKAKKTTKKAAKKKAKKKTTKKKSKAEPKLLEDPKEAETNPGAWNPHTKTLLDKEESRTAAGIDVEDVDVEPSEDVQVGEVDFSDKAKAKKTASKKKKSSKKGKKKASTKKTKKALKPVGKRRPEPTADGEHSIFVEGELPNEGQISFVDHEQDAQRINSNPSLAQQNGEIE